MDKKDIETSKSYFLFAIIKVIDAYNDIDKYSGIINRIRFYFKKNSIMKTLNSIIKDIKNSDIEYESYFLMEFIDTFGNVSTDYLNTFKYTDNHYLMSISYDDIDLNISLFFNKPYEISIEYTNKDYTKNTQYETRISGLETAEFNTTINNIISIAISDYLEYYIRDRITSK